MRLRDLKRLGVVGMSDLHELALIEAESGSSIA
jgi:hypothetical protein